MDLKCRNCDEVFPAEDAVLISARNCRKTFEYKNRIHVVIMGKAQSKLLQMAANAKLKELHNGN
jgi:hypothetical protein